MYAVSLIGKHRMLFLKTATMAEAKNVLMRS